MTAPFDPAAWLRSFEAVGGWFLITSERPVFGWTVETEEQTTAARKLFREVQHSGDRRAAIFRHVRERCLIG